MEKRRKRFSADSLKLPEKSVFSFRVLDFRAKQREKVSYLKPRLNSEHNVIRKNVFLRPNVYPERVKLQGLKDFLPLDGF